MENLTKGELVAAVDFELSELRSATTRPGWTIWALCGSLAAAMSASLSLLEQGHWTLSSYLALAFGGKLLWDCITSLRLLFARPARNLKPFYRSDSIAHGRLSIVLMIFLAVASASTAIALRVAPIWSVTFYALFIVLLLLAFAATYWQLPLRRPRRGWVVHGLFFSIALASGGAVIQASQLLATGKYSFDDVKLAGLLLAAIGLLQIVVSLPQRSALEDDLVSLRRGVSLNELRIPLGSFTLKTLISGYDLGDLFWPLAAKQADLAQQLEGQLRAVGRELDAKIEELAAAPDGEGRRNVALKVLLSYAFVYRELRPRMREIFRSTKAFLRATSSTARFAFWEDHKPLHDLSEYATNHLLLLIASFAELEIRFKKLFQLAHVQETEAAQGVIEGASGHAVPAEFAQSLHEFNDARVSLFSDIINPFTFRQPVRRSPLAKFQIGIRWRSRRLFSKQRRIAAGLPRS